MAAMIGQTHDVPPLPHVPTRRHEARAVAKGKTIDDHRGAKWKNSGELFREYQV
jgi:hypothetical protein